MKLSVLGVLVLSLSFSVAQGGSEDGREGPSQIRGRSSFVRPPLERQRSRSVDPEESVSPSGVGVDILCDPPIIAAQAGSGGSSSALRPPRVERKRSLSQGQEEIIRRMRNRGVPLGTQIDAPVCPRPVRTKASIPETGTFWRSDTMLWVLERLAPEFIAQQGGPLRTIVLGCVDSYATLESIFDSLCWKEKEEGQEYRTNPCLTALSIYKVTSLSEGDFGMIVYQCSLRFPNLKTFAYHPLSEEDKKDMVEILPDVTILSCAEFYKTLQHNRRGNMSEVCAAE